jgi:hypothetical protein
LPARLADRRAAVSQARVRNLGCRAEYAQGRIASSPGRISADHGRDLKVIGELRDHELVLAYTSALLAARAADAAQAEPAIPLDMRCEVGAESDKDL